MCESSVLHQECSSQECFRCKYEMACQTFPRSRIDGKVWTEVLLDSLSLGTTLFLCFVGFFMLFQPRFKKHPYPLMATACLFESWTFNCVSSYGSACRLNSPIYLAFTLNIPNVVFNGAEWQSN